MDMWNTWFCAEDTEKLWVLSLQIKKKKKDQLMHYFKGFLSAAQMLQYSKETRSTIFIFKDVK